MQLASYIAMLATDRALTNHSNNMLVHESMDEDISRGSYTYIYCRESYIAIDAVCIGNNFQYS